GKLNFATFLARTVEEIGQQLRLDRRAVELAAVAARSDGAHRSVGKLHVEAVRAGKIRVLLWLNLDCLALDGVPARCVGGFRFAVAGALEPIDELRRGQFFAGEDLPGSAEDPRRGLRSVAGQPLIDHAAVADPVVGEDPGGYDNGTQGREE